MNRTTFFVGLAVTIFLTAIFALHRTNTVFMGPLESFELDLLDTRFELRGPRASGGQVAILAFDDKTLDEAPELYERRIGHGRVIRAASDAGARVIGLDMFFSDPERLLEAGLIDDIDAYLESSDPSADPTPHGLLTRVQDDVHGDEHLASAIKDVDKVVLAFHVGSQGNLPADDRSLSKGKYGQVAGGEFLPESSGRVVASMAMFNRKAERLGLLTTYNDLSNTVRDIPLALRLGPSVFPPLAVQLVAEYEDINRGKVAMLGTDDTVHIGDRVVQGQDNRMLLNWRGPGAFPLYSVVDLVEGRLPPDALTDRIVIIGFTFLGQDRVHTPFGWRVGPEVHATGVDNILHGDPLKRSTAATDVLISFLVGILVAAFFLPRRFHSIVRLTGAASVLVVCLLIVQLALTSSDLWVTATGPLLVWAGTVLACVAAAYLQEGVQRRYLRRTFAHYLSDDLIEELVSDPSRVALTGQRRELTVLFSDIRNFTTFSEQLPPDDLARFLNAYFTPMTRAVMHNNGYVDKFIGDAVMAIFGAPVTRELNAENGCQAVLDMHASLEALQPMAKEWGIELAIGAGLNTGEMSVGNMGSEERFDYTVLGDAVNLASRIEGLTKRYGVFCLVGPKTAEKAGDIFHFRTIDLVRVKGKNEPVEIFELYGGPKGDIVTYAALEQYGTAIEAWRAGDFPAATRGFTSFSAANPTDEVAALYLSRLETLTQTPSDWDGVFTFKEK